MGVVDQVGRASALEESVELDGGLGEEGEGSQADVEEDQGSSIARGGAQEKKKEKGKGGVERVVVRGREASGRQGDRRVSRCL